MHSPISRRMLPIGGVLCALSFGIAACGGDDDNASTSGGGASTTSGGKAQKVGVLLLAVTVDSVARKGRESAGRA